MKELLGVPIFCGGDVRGALYVTDRRGGGSSRTEDEQVLACSSHHAGLIIEAVVVLTFATGDVRRRTAGPRTSGWCWASVSCRYRARPVTCSASSPPATMR